MKANAETIMAIALKMQQVVEEASENKFFEYGDPRVVTLDILALLAQELIVLAMEIKDE